MDPWIVKLTEFVQKVLLEQDRIRVAGICFGHQIVGRALGGVCDRNEKGWEISITEVNLSEIGKGLFGRNSFVRLPYLYPWLLRLLARHDASCRQHEMALILYYTSIVEDNMSRKNSDI